MSRASASAAASSAARSAAIPKLPKKFPGWYEPLVKYVLHKEKGNKALKPTFASTTQLLQEYWDDYRAEQEAKLPKREKKVADPIKGFGNALKKLETHVTQVIEEGPQDRLDQFLEQIGNAVPATMKPVLGEAMHLVDGNAPAAAAASQPGAPESVIPSLQRAESLFHRVVPGPAEQAVHEQLRNAVVAAAAAYQRSAAAQQLHHSAADAADDAPGQEDGSDGEDPEDAEDAEDAGDPSDGAVAVDESQMPDLQMPSV